MVGQNLCAFRFGSGVRVHAAKLLRAIPDVHSKIEFGAVSIFSISLFQTAINRIEKESGEVMTTSAKTQLIEKVEDVSVRQAELNLLSFFSESVLRQKF